AQFYNYFNGPTPPFFDVPSATPGNYADTVMTTLSFTPRLDTAHQLFGVPNRLLTGIDIYDTHYVSDRPMSPNDPPIHHYDIRQTNVGYYAMNKTSLMPNFDVSLGGRLQNNHIVAHDDYNTALDSCFPFCYASN